MGEHEKAEEMFYLARLYKDHCPQCYYYMGCSLATRGLYDKAIYCWKRTLDLQGSHPPVHVRIAELMLRPEEPQTLLDLSNMLMDVQEGRPAIACLKRLVQLRPVHAKAWQNL